MDKQPFNVRFNKIHTTHEAEIFLPLKYVLPFFFSCVHAYLTCGTKVPGYVAPKKTTNDKRHLTIRGIWEKKTPGQMLAALRYGWHTGGIEMPHIKEDLSTTLTAARGKMLEAKNHHWFTVAIVQTSFAKCPLPISKHAILFGIFFMWQRWLPDNILLPASISSVAVKPSFQRVWFSRAAKHVCKFLWLTVMVDRMSSGRILTTPRCVHEFFFFEVFFKPI